MRQYDKQFKEEAVRLSDEIGMRKAAEQLGIPYYTLAEWRQKRTAYGEKAHVGNGNSRCEPTREQQLEKENAELRRANEILKDALGFFANDRRR